MKGVGLVYRFYQVVFFVGVMYTGVTFLLGNLMDSFDFGLDLDADFDFDMDGDFPMSTVSPLKPIIIVSFITTFGGIGMLGYHWAWGPIKTFLAALLSGILIAAILYKGVIVPLYRVEAGSLAVKRENLIGSKAEVINAIVENGCGKISYIANQNKYTGTAKSITGLRIDQNRQVKIVKIEENIFYVKPFINLKKS